MATPTGLALLREIEQVNRVRRRVLALLMRRPDDDVLRHRFRTQQSKIVALRTALRGPA